MLVCWTRRGRSVPCRAGQARPAIRQVILPHRQQLTLLLLTSSSKYDIITVFIFLACHLYLDKLSQTSCHGLSPLERPFWAGGQQVRKTNQNFVENTVWTLTNEQWASLKAEIISTCTMCVQVRRRPLSWINRSLFACLTNNVSGWSCHRSNSFFLWRQVNRSEPIFRATHNVDPIEIQPTRYRGRYSKISRRAARLSGNLPI